MIKRLVTQILLDIFVTAVVASVTDFNVLAIQAALLVANVFGGYFIWFKW